MNKTTGRPQWELSTPVQADLSEHTTHTNTGMDTEWTRCPHQHRQTSMSTPPISTEQQEDLNENITYINTGVPH